jgi:hypothetical protein
MIKTKKILIQLRSDIDHKLSIITFRLKKVSQKIIHKHLPAFRRRLLVLKASLLKHKYRVLIVFTAIPVIILWGMVVYKFATTPRAPKIKIAEENSPYYFEANSNVFGAKIGDKKTNEPKVEFSLSKSKDKSITFYPASARTGIYAPRQEEKKVVFTDVYQNIDFVYQTIPLGIKEDIVVKAPTDISTYPFFIETNGVNPRYFAENLAGGVFYDDDKNYLFHFEKPFAVDARGVRTDDLGFTIKRDAKSQKLVALLTIDKSWLKSPERAYPITIDPTVIHDESSEFATGTFNRVQDVGSGSDPRLESYYQELPADQYTVGLWHLNEASGNALDSSGNGFTGTPTGTTVVTGLLGNARNFDGSSNIATSVDTQANQLFATTGVSWTVETWFNTTSTSGMLVGRGGGTGTSATFALWVNASGELATVLRGSPSVIATGVNDGKWHHAAVTWNGSTATGYLDGQPINLSVGTAAVQTNNVYLGATGAGASTLYTGSLDEIRISNIARSSEEIKSAASRRPSSVYTSEVLDLTNVASWNSLSWTELGVTTGDGETLADSTDLVAQWNFNETSGTTASNAAGSCGASCDGTLTNFASTASQDQAAGTGWTANNRRWGAGALMFDGVNDNVLLSGDPTSLSFERTNSFSIETWIKTNSTTGYKAIVSKMANSSPFRGYELAINGTAPFFQLINTNTSNDLKITASGTNISDGNWHHVVATYDGSSTAAGTNIYVDGALQAKTITSNTLSATIITTQNVAIGGRANAGSFFPGVIDSTRVYSRALNAAEILSNYQAGQIELQTRVGGTTTPDDGSWGDWSPVSGETQILTMDTDQADWVWDNSATFVPKTQSNDTNIKVEGSGSLKQVVGQPQADANTVGLWHLDETDGTGAYIKDSSGNGNHGTPTGTTLTQGISDKARSFNGSSDLINAGDINAIDTATTLSACAWVYHNNDTADHSILHKGPGVTDGIYLFRDDVGSVSGRTDIYTIFIADSNSTGNTRVESATNTALSGKWNQVCFTFQANSATGLRLYINGVEDPNSPASTTGITGINGGTNPLRIGNFDGTSTWFNGSIDEVVISNIARSAEEIAEAYRMGRDHYINRTISSTDLSAKTTLPFYVAADRPGNYLQASIGETPYSLGQPDANTVGLWRLEEHAGSGAYLKDSSGNNNHGTPTGTTHTEGKVGKARRFSTSDYITHPLNAWNPSAATIEMWINPTWNGNDGLVHGLWQNNNTTNINQANWVSLFKWSSNMLYLRVVSPSAGLQDCITDATNIFTSGKWTHIAASYNSSGSRIYANGALICSTGAITPPNAALDTNGRIGYGHSTNYIGGSIDEVRISNIARSSEEIRGAYEYGMGLRSHDITIDFAANLDSGDLISGSGDTSFTIDATTQGLSTKGSMLFPGDKVIVRENYDGTEYIAQGTVTGVTASTGAVTVSSWDSGSTFPSGGYTAGASVFKWQREYWNHRGEVLDSHLDGITQLSLRLTNGSEGRTIWLDDLKSSGGYLTTPGGSTITSSVGNRYFQYRAVLSSSDEVVSPQLSMVTLDYVDNATPNTPTLDSPADTATNQNLTPILQTTATDDDGDYIRYKIELCEDVGMTSNCQTFDQTSSQTGWSGQNAETGTAYTSGTQATYTVQTPLDPGTTYYWRSYAIDPGGSNMFSSTQGTPYSFTTTTAPTAPTDLLTEGLTNPSGVFDLTPEFSAIHNDTDGDSANYYQVEVNTASDFTGTVMWNSGQTAMTVTANGARSPDISYAGTALSFNGSTYYWRIKFWDVNGAMGTVSATANFTMNTIPATPSLDSPLNGATGVSAAPELKTTGTDADSDYLRYKIELCEDSGMTSNCQTFDQTSSQAGWSGQDAETGTAYASGTQATHTVQTALDPSTTYYWRSYAIDPGGSNTLSSTQTPYSFTTTAGPASATSCVASLAPDASSINFTWTDNALDEDFYEVQRNVNGGGFTVLATGLAANTTSNLDSTISPGNTYQYRVAPYYSAGPTYGAWCVSATLSVDVGIFEAKGLNLRGITID